MVWGLFLSSFTRQSAHIFERVCVRTGGRVGGLVLENQMERFINTHSPHVSIQLPISPYMHTVFGYTISGLLFTDVPFDKYCSAMHPANYS